MTAGRARRLLLCNAAGAAGYAVLHLYLAWARNLPVNVNFWLLALLVVVALVCTRLDYRVGFAIYAATLWFAVTVMVMVYAGDPRCTGVPGVLYWLALGAAMAGVAGNRQAVFYIKFSAVTFLCVVLAYNDLGYVLIRYPLIVGAVAVGVILREYERAKGQLNKLETAQRILENAPQGRENPW